MKDHFSDELRLSASSLKFPHTRGNEGENRVLPWKKSLRSVPFVEKIKNEYLVYFSKVMKYGNFYDYLPVLINNSLFYPQ